MLRFVGAVMALSCLVAKPASAGPLVPGESGSDFEDDLIRSLPPESEYRGALLAERSQPFVFEVIIAAGEEQGQRVFATGTFTSRVYRDVGTGGLAFLYLLAQTGSNSVVDFETLAQRGFSGGPLDVYTSIDEFFVRRSADGDRLDWVFEYDDLTAEFLVRTGPGSFGLVPGGFDVDVEFEPSRGSDSVRFDAYAVVPEPSAAAAALTAAVGLLLRRVRR